MSCDSLIEPAKRGLANESGFRFLGSSACETGHEERRLKSSGPRDPRLGALTRPRPRFKCPALDGTVEESPTAAQRAQSPFLGMFGAAEIRRDLKASVRSQEAPVTSRVTQSDRRMRQSLPMTSMLASSVETRRTAPACGS